MGNSIIQNWAANLGLRHQGVLVSVTRGCDAVPREDTAKMMVRMLRPMILKAHVGDPRKATSFMVWPSEEMFYGHMTSFVHSLDHYPVHFLTHFMFAAEIVGYKCPWPEAAWWLDCYNRIVHKLHLNPETEEQLDARLNASEEDFKKAQE